MGPMVVKEKVERVKTKFEKKVEELKIELKKITHDFIEENSFLNSIKRNCVDNVKIGGFKNVSSTSKRTPNTSVELSRSNQSVNKVKSIQSGTLEKINIEMKKDLESSSKEMDTSYTPRNISGPQKLLTLNKDNDKSDFIKDSFSDKTIDSLSDEEKPRK